MDAIFVSTVNVIDPESGGEVELEVWKDPSSGGMFAIDSSFLDQVSDSIQSPFNPKVSLALRHVDEYIPKDKCVASGRHLVSCDDDGYCDSCGEQEE